MDKPQRPFTKLFSYKDKIYCYDVGTNHIMRINKVLADVLKKYDYTNTDSVIRFFEKRYDGKDVCRAIQMIDTFNREQGGFISGGKVNLEFPVEEEKFRWLTDNFLNHLILNVTEKCNFRCQYCSFSGSCRYDRLHSHRSMSWQMMKDSIDFFLKRSKYIVEQTKRRLILGFYGGEPLLEYERVFRLVEYIKRNYKNIFPRFFFSVTTNGSQLTKDVIHKLIAYNFSVKISLDGPKEIHDRYRVSEDGAGTFDRIRNNLDLFKKIDERFFRENLGFAVVLAPEYEIERIFEFFLDNYPDHLPNVSFSKVNPFDTYFFDSFNMIAEEKKFDITLEKFKEEYIKSKESSKKDLLLNSLFEGEVSQIHTRGLFPLPDSSYPNGICMPGIKRLFVDVEGNLHLCERTNGKFSFGNIYDGFDVKKVFLLVNKYIEAADNCHNCWAVRFCSDCFLSAIKDGDFSRERKRVNCAMSRKKILSFMKAYIEILDRNPKAFQEKLTYVEDNIIEEALNTVNKIRVRSI
jgi:uncharacterized protein